MASIFPHGRVDGRAARFAVRPAMTGARMSERGRSPLQSSREDWSAFLVSDQTIGDALTTVSRLAVDAVAPAMFAGMTMMVHDQLTTQAFTDPMCPEIDQAQYTSGHGPCLAAFGNASTIVVECLEHDGRWPEFAAVATARGVRSTMSLPLVSGETPVGALNFYAGADGAFGEAEVQIGRSFAAQAIVVLANAQANWAARSKSERLE